MLNHKIDGDELVFECGCRFPITDHTIREANGLPRIDIDYYNLPMDCSATWDVFAHSTKGVFQLETRLGNSYSKKLKPENIEHLSALISILRPGVLKAVFDNKSVTQHYIDKKRARRTCTRTSTY